MPNTTVKFEAIGVDKTAAAFTSVSDRIDRMAGIAKRVAGVMAGAWVMKKIGSGIVESVKRMDALGDSAQKLGISTKTLQQMSFAFDQAGVGGQELVDNVLPKMTKALTDETAIKTMQSLGVSLDDIKSKTPDQQFKALGKVIAGIPSEAERARVAFQLFGKGYAPLLPLFRQGGDTFAESFQKVMDYAPVASDASVQAGAKMQEGLDALGAGFKTTFDTILGDSIGWAEKHFGRLDAAIPIMWETIKAFAKFVVIRFQDLGSNIAEIWRAMSSDWGKTLKWMANGLWGWIKALGSMIAQFGKNIWKWLTEGTWDQSSLTETWKKFIDASKPEFSKIGANITWSNTDALFAELDAKTRAIREGVAAKDKLATGAAGTEIESVLDAGKKAAEAIKDAKYIDASTYEAFKMVMGGRGPISGIASGVRSGSRPEGTAVADEINRLVQPLRDILTELKGQTRIWQGVGAI